MNWLILPRDDPQDGCYVSTCSSAASLRLANSFPRRRLEEDIVDAFFVRIILSTAVASMSWSTIPGIQVEMR